MSLDDVTTAGRTIVALVSTLLVVACSRERPGPPPIIPTTAPAPSSTPDATSSDADRTTIPDAATPAPSASTAQRPPPTEPPSIFRRIAAGMLPSTGLRETWTLRRHGAELVLQLSVDESTQNVMIDGLEREESNWKNVGGATWSAPGSSTPLPLRLEESQGVWGRAKGKGRPVPNTLTMRCKTATLSVLSGEAVLVHGDVCGNGGPRPHWKPKEKKAVPIQRCTFDELPQNEDAQAWEGIPSFAREPGVEFVFDNSDCSAQEGAYRQIGAAKR